MAEREDNIVYTTVEFIGMIKKKKKDQLFITMTHEFNGKLMSKDYFIKPGDSITVTQGIDLDTEKLELILAENKGKVQ